MLKITSLFTIYCNGQGVNHIFYSLCSQWQGPDIQARMVVPNCQPLLRNTNLVEGIPQFLKWWYYRRPDNPRYMAEKRFLRDLKDFDAAYLWPATTLETFKKVKQSGKPIFLERFNCYPGKSKQILDDAYRHLGLSPQHQITAEGIQREETEAEAADFIFCPSPEVKTSFQEAGVPEEKLLLTSYGWSRKRFPAIPPQKPASETLTFIFVGSVCVRKGVHILLRAWKRAQIKGRLMLCGSMEPAIAEACSDLLSQENVVHLEYNPDLSSTYAQADVFVFPSLEEGSPLVVYEAMAHGLAVIVSPMGAGGIARDGIDGLVISPYEEDAWVEALRNVADLNLCRRFGNAARLRAEEFTWEKVADRRGKLMIARL
ncbi:glycosyltransferase family 4 protein [Aetokthonos hydrillicola]|jgi:glycosyltransferase involved in cell wall biosynthesis|uniref:glycosyltransferase family 4 protein n=1 Tax=Aetokthonos hydrillicola TaxID=1550245 RepID=UPI001ABAC558|nr:glycosyltransferase family 4 protein [Aetokthonos hydrillicola]MBO3462583.1 glycosyltransferase family 4 protein [Aetokthonos hydrillicola CCALA 1050]MBW4589575.1 glycosyltransferase family 4 protein [Aetokthonos hydrillicola CCALA 1050]